MTHQTGHARRHLSAAHHKGFLRASIRRARKNSPAVPAAAFTSQIFATVSQFAAAPATVAAFLPFGSEPPILPALTELYRQGYRIAVPVVLTGRELGWVWWNPDTPLVQNSLGIPEPDGPRHGAHLFLEADIRLVPALAFDRAGRRLGQGGGFYDTLLEALPTPALSSTFGLVYEREILDGLPADPWDAVLTWVITESGTRQLGDQ